ncbi:2'-5' RNA ligase family protein [Piscirickettsia litoralis]|uniref:2'-5' RNA ligase n=1 Tax=Piscirickettsia litoralis TaxID=1891921 RepID=A0ABX3A195_9GAMM|nr:2'-5' RNA ligase family protein [Piscirickettsia litoralis]ODN42641.1 hypothetical protein BGC07_06530 [Piscirickettsia litoralis]
MFKGMFFSIALLCCVVLQSSMAAGSVSYDIFLVPDKAAHHTVNKISEELQQVGLESLFKQGYLPHITLYLTGYPATTLDSLKKQVKRLASRWSPFAVKFDRLQPTKNNWLMLQVKNSRKLQRLADEVTLAAEPLRAANPKLPNWVLKYPNKLEAFKRYGSPNVFSNFQPHITILAKSNQSQLTNFMSRFGEHFKPAQVKVLGIGIARVNNNGQVIKELAIYYFKK